MRRVAGTGLALVLVALASPATAGPDDRLEVQFKEDGKEPGCTAFTLAFIRCEEVADFRKGDPRKLVREKVGEFYIAETAVTVGQLRTALGDRAFEALLESVKKGRVDPAEYKTKAADPTLPARYVAAADAQLLCEALARRRAPASGALSKLEYHEYRLPSATEWQRAALGKLAREAPPHHFALRAGAKPGLEAVREEMEDLQLQYKAWNSRPEGLSAGLEKAGDLHALLLHMNEKTPTARSAIKAYLLDAHGWVLPSDGGDPSIGRSPVPHGESRVNTLGIKGMLGEGVEWARGEGSSLVLCGHGPGTPYVKLGAGTLHQLAAWAATGSLGEAPLPQVAVENEARVRVVLQRRLAPDWPAVLAELVEEKKLPAEKQAEVVARIGSLDAGQAAPAKAFLEVLLAQGDPGKLGKALEALEKEGDFKGEEAALKALSRPRGRE